jgi:clan AA aspartic protease (TIGR02281 family)
LPARSEYYQYSDDNGTISFTDNPGNIPKKIREKRAVVERNDDPEESAETATRFKFIRNQILVPVKVRFRGVEQTATFLLDTGASTCTISPALAKRLNINSRETNAGLAQGVGGSVHLVGRTVLDSVTVGPHRKADIEVSVIHTGDNDGLLGMNFLHGLRYQINFDTRQLVWNK